MHPLVARFHDEVSLLDPAKKAQIESMLSSAAKGFGDQSLEQITATAAATDSWWGEPGSFLSFLRPYIVVDGILQIPVKGVLLNDFPYTFGSYATGYIYISRAFMRGLDDPAVRGIAFVINSPGGAVAECFDLVDRIYSYRGNKPVRAFAHENAYSAAYAIASVADKIVVSRTGGVGSIGVLTTHVSYEEAYKKMGIEVTYIYAGKHKVDGNRFKALSEEARERIQTKIDTLYDMFVQTVARNRDMDEKKVRNTEAATFMANEAVANGLADSISTLEDAAAEFLAEINDGDTEMARTTAEQAHYDAGRTDAKTEHDRALAEMQTSHAAALKQADTNAKARITGILACENAKDRPTSAMAAALETDMTVEQANSFLGKLPKESAASAASAADTSTAATKPKSDFEKAMDAAEHPEAGSTDAATGKGGKEPEKSSRAKRALANAGFSVKAA